MSIREVLAALGDRAKAKGPNHWMARCPAHDDRRESLSITLKDDGRVLAKCFAECPTEAIIDALGLKMGSLFADDVEVVESLPASKWPVTATYLYHDEAGKVRFMVQRRTSPDSGKKTFVQSAADSHGGWKTGTGCMDGVRRVPYKLPELLASKGLVLVAEGEKDVDNLAKLGLTATTNAGGAGRWDPEWAQYFEGRTVVILPDNDDPGRKHAEDVRSSLEGVASSVSVLELPGLMKKGDVSDWLASGGTKERLLALVATASFSGFRSAAERLYGERDERLSEAGSVLTYGVQYLDDATSGIASHDLVLLGAKTGVGKTALATICALANARAGKRVYFFALEAERREIERRMKWTHISELYFARTHPYDRVPIRYIDWRNGKLERVVGSLEKDAEALTLEATKNLFTFYRTNSFADGDFGKHVASVREAADLVVLDHFHYLDSDDREQNRAHEVAAKGIRDTGLMAGVPVLMVAHTRKTDRRTEGIVPQLDDFMGSSHLSKVVTMAVMLAPAYAVPSADKHIWPTFIHVPKLRGDSSVSRYVGLVGFDARTNSYRPKYQVGRFADSGAKFVELAPDDWPDWATGATDGSRMSRGDAGLSAAEEDSER